MAITGLIGVGFVVVHMVGNLKVYLGLVTHDGQREYDIDVYGEFLRDMLVPLLPRTYFLWGLRLVLIGALLLHLHAAYSLTMLNRRARRHQLPGPRDYVAANFASRTMRWSGIIVLLFLAWHLADLTWGWVNPGFERGAVVPQPRRQPVAAAGGDPLHRRQHRARHPPLPRLLEPVPVARLELAAVQPVAPGGGGGDRHDHRRRQRARSRSPCRPGSSRCPHDRRTDGALDDRVLEPGLEVGSDARLDAHIPDGPVPDKWTNFKATSASSTRTTSASSRSSWSAPGSPARRRAPRSPSSAIRSRRSRSTTRRAVRTRSPPRAASTPPRTTPATATASTGSSTTRSRAATSARARRTSTGSPRCR